MRISIKVKLKAKKEGIEKIDDNNFVVSVRAIPKNGEANTALIKILSKYFKTPISKIKIVLGHTSRNKVVEIG